MANRTDDLPAADQDHPRRAVESEKSWAQRHRNIVKLELAAINTRRRAREAVRLAKGQERRERDGSPPPEEPPFATLRYPGDKQVIETVGLALSGGGIR